MLIFTVPAVAVAPTIRATALVLGEPALVGEPEELGLQLQVMDYARAAMVRTDMAVVEVAPLPMAARLAAPLMVEGETVVPEQCSFGTRQSLKQYQRSLSLMLSETQFRPTRPSLPRLHLGVEILFLERASPHQLQFKVCQPSTLCILRVTPQLATKSHSPHKSDQKPLR
jgi:hypothetical protein